jgi:hypothetical protein
VIRILFDNHVFIYILLALAGCGILMKLVVQVLYFRLLRASEAMSTSNNKLAKNMKKKFEAYYKLKLGVNNVDIFVDKHFFHYKFCGIYLSTWETLCGQVLILSLLVGAISTILGLIYECGKNQILSTFTVGISCCGLLIFLEGLINSAGKKEMIRINMKDYLENVLKVRLVQEENQPELMEQYKKAYQPTSDMAVTKEQPDKNELKPFHQKKKVKSREAKRLEKMSQKARQKDEVAKNKSNRKQQAMQKKLEAQEQKNALKEAKQKAKEEKLQAIKANKEAKKQEAAKRKAQILENEQLKKEEKKHQKEIRKVLELEKKHRGNKRTSAQEKKENLLKEIHGRRETEDRLEEVTQFRENPEDIETLLNIQNSDRKEVEKEWATESKPEERKESSFLAKESPVVHTLEPEEKLVKSAEAKREERTSSEIKIADVKAAKIRDIKARQITAAPDITYKDDRTAAALENGRSYKSRDFQMLKPTSEEEEKIFEDILKDIFS